MKNDVKYYPAVILPSLDLQSLAQSRWPGLNWPFSDITPMVNLL